MARKTFPQSTKVTRVSGPARKSSGGTARARSVNGTAPAETTSSSQRRRRSADPGRQRDPTRTRQSILDAATEEFGRFGYDGARVMRIAERAGVAHQLITYHFGGKKGLFDALSDDWLTTTRNVTESDASFVEMLSTLIHQGNEQSAWASALIREGLQRQDHAHLAERLVPFRTIARERQQRGEIAPDLDAGIVALMLFAANLAPTVMPHITRAFSQVDPSDPSFVDYYSEQLGLVFKHLAAPPASC